MSVGQVTTLGVRIDISRVSLGKPAPLLPHQDTSLARSQSERPPNARYGLFVRAGIVASLERGAM